MATLPVFRTWVAGEVVTAAYFNANVRDAGNFFLSVPVAELVQTVAQSISNAAFNTLTFDSEIIDNDGGHSTVSNTSRYVPKTPGRFQFSGLFSFASNATGLRISAWDLNSGTLIPSGSTQQATISGSDIELSTRCVTQFMNGTTDFMELAVEQTSGGALNTFVSTAWSRPGMSVRWVGSA